MRVCHGLAGEAVEVDDQELQWRRPLEIVRQLARDRWGAEAGDLIVLVAGGSLLGSSGSQVEPGAGRDVFFFLRSDLAPEADGVPELLAPDPNNLQGLDDVGGMQVDEDDAGDPAFAVFRGNIAEARRRLAEARPTAALAARCEARVEVQRLAARAVLDNLLHQRSTCSNSMALFLQKYDRVREKFEQSLAKVDVSLSALAAVRLHPALRRPGRETLGDAVPRDRIARFAAGLQAERAQLGQRLEKLRRQDTQAQSLCDQVAEKVRRFLEDDAVLAAASGVRREYERAERESLAALRAVLPSPGAAPSSVLEVEKKSAALLADLSRACRDVALVRLSELQLCWDRQRASLLQRLREVSYVQAKVRNVERQAALLEEEINMQRNHSLQLSHLQKMPRAYHRALLEIARRKQFRARYVAQGEDARKTLARMVEEENVRRQAFVQRYGCHLPAELIPGLGALALPATLEVPEFDQQLPDVSSPPKEASELGGTADLSSEMGDRQASSDEHGGADAGAHCAAAGGRDRCSSASSCSSSLRSPWPPGNSSVPGAGSGSSNPGSSGSQSAATGAVAGLPQASSADAGQSPATMSQEPGDDLAAGAMQHRIEELEARNRELEAKVADLMQELSRWRTASTMVNSEARAVAAASPAGDVAAGQTATSEDVADGVLAEAAQVLQSHPVEASVMHDE